MRRNGRAPCCCSRCPALSAGREPGGGWCAIALGEESRVSMSASGVNCGVQSTDQGSVSSWEGALARQPTRSFSEGPAKHQSAAVNTTLLEQPAHAHRHHSPRRSWKAQITSRDMTCPPLTDAVSVCSQSGRGGAAPHFSESGASQLAARARAPLHHFAPSRRASPRPPTPRPLQGLHVGSLDADPIPEGPSAALLVFFCTVRKRKSEMQCIAAMAIFARKPRK